MSSGRADLPYDISVIVPVYNVEEYIRDCLDSLLRQDNVSLQVIMVDDGSSDGSGKTADDYADRYENFFCYHKPNGGAGSARNYGVRYAEGKYIAFADSDDVVADGIYEKMLLRAEKDGSDITICNVAKFETDVNEDTYMSTLHMKVFRSIKQITHIEDNYDLLYDTTCWNKLILRSFYEKNAFKFPEGIIYEDIPFNIIMHLTANHVSVLCDIGYYWRRRTGTNRSSTQKRDDIRSFKDRLTAMKLVDAYFKEHDLSHGIDIARQVKTLRTDFTLFISMCNEITDEYLCYIIDVVNEYIGSEISREAFDALDPGLKQVYSQIQSGDPDAVRSAWNSYNETAGLYTDPGHTEVI